MAKGSKKYKTALRRFLAEQLWSHRSKDDLPGDSYQDWVEAGRLLESFRVRQYTRLRLILSRTVHWTGFRDKTLWEILTTVLLPLSLIGATALFNRATEQDSLDRAFSQKRVELDKLADSERQKIMIEYFNDLMTLVKAENPWTCQDAINQCKTWNKGGTAYSIAQAKTLVALQVLDPRRQRLMIQFLQSSGLNTLNGNSGLLSGGSIARANLRGADLEGLNLNHVDLQYSSLQGANLVRASLMKANLKGSNLSDAKLDRSNLIDANLQEALLFRANLVCARLYNADFTGAMLSGAKFYENDEQLKVSANKCPSSDGWTDFSVYRVDADTEVYNAKSFKNAIYNANKQEVYIRTIRGRPEKQIATSWFNPMRLPFERPYATEEPTIFGSEKIERIVQKLTCESKGPLRLFNGESIEKSTPMNCDS